MRADPPVIVSLKKRADFLAVQQGGRKWVAPALILFAHTGTPESVRYGITVTKKTAKRAVDRNRIKRRLRAAVQTVWGPQMIPGHDVVLIGRALTGDIPYNDLLREGTWCLKRLGLLAS